MAKKSKQVESDDSVEETGFKPRAKSQVSKEGTVMVTIGYKKIDAEFLDGIAAEHTNGNRTQLVRECIRFGLKQMGLTLPTEG